LLDRSKGRRQTKRDTKPDAGSSVISRGLKHRANDARDGSSSYSNRRDQSGLNGCCTAMWKANGKTITLSLFLESLCTLQAADQKYLESFEMWCWRRMEKISWTDHVRSEEVLLRVSE